MLRKISEGLIKNTEWQRIDNTLTIVTGDPNWTEKEAIDVMAYSLTKFVKSISWITLLLFTAYYLNILSEVITFLLLFVPLRTVSGGAHLNNSIACIFLSIILPITATILAKNIAIDIVTVLSLSVIILILQSKYGVINARKSKSKLSKKVFIKLGIGMTMINVICAWYLPIAKYAIIMQAISLNLGLIQQNKAAIPKLRL